MNKRKSSTKFYDTGVGLYLCLWWSRFCVFLTSFYQFRLLSLESPDRWFHVKRIVLARDSPIDFTLVPLATVAINSATGLILDATHERDRLLWRFEQCFAHLDSDSGNNLMPIVWHRSHERSPWFSRPSWRQMISQVLECGALQHFSMLFLCFNCSKRAD